MTRALLTSLAALLLCGCLDVDQVVDPGASPASMYFKLSWPDGSPERRRVEDSVVRVMAQYPVEYAPLVLKRIREGARVGLEWEGPLVGNTNFEGTPLLPTVTDKLVLIDIPLPDLYAPESLVSTNAWVQALLGGSSYRLVVRTAEKVASASLQAGGMSVPLKVVPLRDLVMVEAPLYLFAAAYKRAQVRVDLGSSNAIPAPDLAARQAGEAFQAGVIAFDRGDNLTAHGYFARLFHEARLSDGDLFFYYAFTSVLVDRDPGQARSLYLLALDWFKTHRSVMPWENNREKAWLMLGLLYADPKVPFADKALAKKTFDQGLVENPANRWIRQVYEKVTGEKPPAAPGG